MTAAEQIEKRGMQKGMLIGRQEEKLGIARNMLSKLHLGVDAVEQATGLSKKEIEQLLAEKSNQQVAHKH